jgi:hypothetical protein
MRYNTLRAGWLVSISVAALAACSTGTTTAPTASAPAASSGPASFFITSVGSGKGGDLGGLSGADSHCQKLAAAAGHGGKTWKAYLSTPLVAAAGNSPAVDSVHARDRIGSGPWYNVKGQLIARDLAHLHNGNLISKANALDEKGNIVKGRGDTPNEHDILTGSRADGTAHSPRGDSSCNRWTSSGDGSAIVGHHDLTGPNNDNWAKSWNFSHPSAGCSQAQLVSTGGSGRFYCFAAN